MPQLRLGQMLVMSGSITQPQLDEAMKRQKITRERIGDILIKSGWITETKLIETLQKQLDIEYVDLARTVIPTEMAQVIPKTIAERYRIVPVRLEGDNLCLAMSDPTNIYATDAAQQASRRQIIPMLASPKQLERAIKVLYSSEGAARAIADLARSSGSAALHEAPDTVFAGSRVDASDAGAPAVRLVNSILERAVTEQASDIHFEPREEAMLVRMRIDGLMRNILTVPRDIQHSVISRLKIMCGMDIAERRVPQDGRFQIRAPGREIDLRASTLPTVYGEKLVVRLLDRAEGRAALENLGLGPEDRKHCEALLRIHSGMLLLTGPTGSGKTTTMHAMVNRLNSPEVNIVTLEDPVEYNIDGVNQVQINEKTGMTFAGGLRAVLRQDPDIIAVGEIRDGETADIAMRSAMTGHVVLSTIHTNDAVGVIDRLRDIGVAPYIIAAALKGVVSQRLVRRVCPRCRSAYYPDRAELAALGMAEEAGIRLYRGTGCRECFHSGYRGRLAVFEIMPITPRIRKLIYEEGGREAVEREFRRPENAFVSLLDNARRLLREGVTTGSEILRVVMEEE